MATPGTPPSLTRSSSGGGKAVGVLSIPSTRVRTGSFVPTWTPRAADAFGQVISGLVDGGCPHSYDLHEVLDCGCWACSCCYKEVEVYHSALKGNNSGTTPVTPPRCRQPRCQANFSVQDMLCGLRNVEALLDLGSEVLKEAVASAEKKESAHKNALLSSCRHLVALLLSKGDEVTASQHEGVLVDTLTELTQAVPASGRTPVALHAFALLTSPASPFITFLAKLPTASPAPSTEVLEALAHLVFKLGSNYLLCASLDAGLSSRSQGPAAAATCRVALLDLLRPYLQSSYWQHHHQGNAAEAAFIVNLSRWREQHKVNLARRSWSGRAARFRSEELLGRAAAAGDLVDYVYLKEATAQACGVGRPSTTSNGRVMKEVKRFALLEQQSLQQIGFDGWLRADVDNVRCLKVLLRGPKQTPYEHGLFEFDLLYPDDYPFSPPLVTFKTTAGGRIRFNPNLYKNGKVCLSLLGTWHGEPWSPASTMAHVLLSIQGFVFSDQPFFNEPGCEKLRGTPGGDLASQAYNASVREATVRAAMIQHLHRPPPLFHDVVLSHFAENAEEILEQTDKWAAEAEAADTSCRRQQPQSNYVGCHGKGADMRAAHRELKHMLEQSFLSEADGSHVMTTNARRWAMAATAAMVLVVGGLTVAAATAVWLRSRGGKRDAFR